MPSLFPARRAARRGVLSTVVLLAALTALALVQAPAGHARTTVRLGVSVTSHQSAHTFVVHARSAPKATCGLLVVVPGSSQALPELRADGAGRATWKWSATARAPRGRWSFAVRCAKGGDRALRRTARHLRRGAIRGTIGEPSSFRVVHGVVLPHRRASDPKGLGGVANPFPWHQCTWWAWVKRADVYDAAVARGVPRGGSRGRSQGETVYVWDGSQWVGNAQKAGIPTGQTPVAGALVGFDAYAGNPYGHVAYVESVESPTRILISECNGFTEVCGQRWMNPLAAKGRLQGYVYGGPAATPGAPPPPPPVTPASPKLSIAGTCTSTGGTLAGASSGFTPGGTATIRAWYPNGSEYTNLVHVSRVRADGSIAWTWPCAGDQAGTYMTEAVDDQTGASTGRVPFVIGAQNASGGTTPPVPPPTTSVTLTVYNKVTNGATAMREDTPAYLSTRPANFCKRDGCAIGGTDRATGGTYAPAVCQVQGPRTTNGNDGDAGDDGNPGLFSSTRWYGIRLGDGGLGYISEVWIDPSQRGGLGLAGC